MEASHLEIGGLHFRFDGCRSELLPGAFADFAAGEAAPHAQYRVERAQALTRGAEPLVADGGIWRLYGDRSRQWLEFYALPRCGYQPVVQAELSSDWSRGTLRVDPELAPELLQAAPIVTAGELLLMGLLGRGRGLYVHAAAALWPDGVDLYLGTSGAGKSTLSGIAKKHGAQVLSDDRTVLRLEDGELVAYGTPFHGTGLHWAARRGRVRSLCFLAKAPESTLERLSPAQAAFRLAAVNFAPRWERSALEHSLRLCELACRLVPTYLLRFRPDVSALETIESAVAHP